MKQEEQITQQFVQVTLTILNDARSELYLNMRYLDLALSALAFQVTTQMSGRGIGTDGAVLAVHPKALADLYLQDRRLVNRVYLHEVLHCLLRHPFKAPRQDELLWQISCDIAVESIVDGMNARSVRTGISRVRKNWYDLLGASLKVLTAEGVYRILRARTLTAFELAALQEAFCIDEHILWPAAQGKSPSPKIPEPMLQERWQDLSEKVKVKMESFAREQAQGSGKLEEMIRTENRERYDYKSFLRRFAVLKEQVMVDPDSFDYVFYTFGLSLYGNMPLIEPLETRSVRRIEDFVVVLDVSMSTSGALVRTFLEQTYSVLTEKETYLRKVNIHIVQCDEQVRDDVKITSREELDSYMNGFALKGGGGTDFRPAFTYVAQLVSTGQMHDLRGMIYFTDGRGTYPKKRPAWETAFVFMQEDYTDAAVPPWAIRLILEPEQLEQEEAAPRTDYRFR